MGVATQWQVMAVTPTVLWKQAGAVTMEDTRLLTSALRSVVKSWPTIKAHMSVMMATITTGMDALLTAPLSSGGLVEVALLVLQTPVTLSVRMDGSELLKSVMMETTSQTMVAPLHVSATPTAPPPQAQPSSSVQ